MDFSKTDYSTIGKWSHTDQAYIAQDPALKPYFSYKPEMESFPELEILLKFLDDSKRGVLR